MARVLYSENVTSDRIALAISLVIVRFGKTERR